MDADQGSIHLFKVALHEVDAAGFVFFAHLFRHAHDAYEGFMAALGFPLPELVRGGEWLLPLVHAEADYRAPLRHGDIVQVRVEVAAVSRGSFTIAYEVAGPTGLAATLRTVHACLSPATGRGVPLPEALRLALSRSLPGGSPGVVLGALDTLGLDESSKGGCAP